MKKGFFIAASALFIFSGCKKDEAKTCTIDKASVAGSYKLTSAKYKASASAPEIDAISFFFSDACEKDDILTLKTDNTATLVDAGVKCSPEGGETDDWSLTGTTITLPVFDVIGTVTGFDCTNLVIVSENGLTTGDKMTINLQKQ